MQIEFELQLEASPEGPVLHRQGLVCCSGAHKILMAARQHLCPRKRRKHLNVIFLWLIYSHVLRCTAHLERLLHAQ